MTPRRPSERPTSGDTRIATVAAGGPPVQGVGVGQADVTAYLTNVPVNAGQICAATDPSCPPPYNPEPTGGVSVTPTVSAQCNSATLVMTVARPAKLAQLKLEISCFA